MNIFKRGKVKLLHASGIKEGAEVMLDFFGWTSARRDGLYSSILRRDVRDLWERIELSLERVLSKEELDELRKMLKA